MKNIISHKEQTCEDLNKKQIKIYNDQIKFVEDQICDHCKKDFWETLDLTLRSYYYDQQEDSDLIPFDINLFNDNQICSECKDQWKQYIEMDDQRYRLDLKKEKCYKQLQVLENNEQMLNKFTI